MRAVFCQNKYKSDGQDRLCGRVLAVLPDRVVRLLKSTNETIILRCPRCGASVRWIAVRGDVGELVFDPGIEPESWQGIQFDRVLGITES